MQTFDFCKYKNIFGEPGKGAHSYRFMNVAIVDVVLTFLVAWIISYFTKYSYVYVLATLFLLGIYLHWLFCVDTTIHRAIKTSLS
uniref:Uncharacterized protein n=1 Tax=viral metagenome TaxID=1070528 RepID=A0A6C0DR87_9ZZZZ